MKKLFVTAIALASMIVAVNFAHAKATRGACNGGQCIGNGGKVFECPESGGPTCEGDETCICRCKKDGNSYTPTNECGKLKSYEYMEFDDGVVEVIR